MSANKFRCSKSLCTLLRSRSIGEMGYCSLGCSIFVYAFVSFWTTCSIATTIFKVDIFDMNEESVKEMTERYSDDREVNEGDYEATLVAVLVSYALVEAVAFFVFFAWVECSHELTDKSHVLTILEYFMFVFAVGIIILFWAKDYMETKTGGEFNIGVALCIRELALMFSAWHYYRAENHDPRSPPWIGIDTFAQIMLYFMTAAPFFLSRGSVRFLSCSRDQHTYRMCGCASHGEQKGPPSARLCFVVGGLITSILLYQGMTMKSVTRWLTVALALSSSHLVFSPFTSAS